MAEPTAVAGEINGEAFDRYTLLHFGVGLVFGLAGAPAFASSLVAIGWELIERPLKDAFPVAFPVSTQDTAVNSLVDSGAMMLGWGIAEVITAWIESRKTG